MRRKIIAGNWKMNLDCEQGMALAAAIAKGAGASPAADVVLCPPSVYLTAIAQVIEGSAVGLGAQNCHFESKGAFTGEVSPGMLLDVGCKYVILGHSERRKLFGETDEFINKKTLAALAAGLIPIVCVGETLAEREAGDTSKVVRSQCTGSLAGLTAEQMAQTVIAYEPVWAIGTGKVATTEQAEEVHADLRKLLETLYSPEVAAQVRIQYGGSVTADNAGQLLQQPNIDGALVGGASLKPESFLAIVSSAG